MNPDDLEDIEWIRRIGKSDQAAFERLYGRYQMPILRYCRQMTSSAADAEDLFQDIFVAVWNQARYFQQRSTVRTWMFRIAHNRMVDQYRRKRPVVELPEETLEEISAPFAESGDADIVWALRQIPGDQREVIELAFFEEIPYKEIAEIMGCPLGTVKSRMNAALQRLEGLLKRVQ